MLLDTHIWIWWINRSTELPKPAFDFLDQLDTKPLLADISLWEVGMLVKKQRIQLKVPLLDWLNAAVQAVTVLPISANIAEKVASMPESLHGDPADRLIVATSLEMRVPLVTRDKKIRDSGLVRIMDLPG
jgi:PIN domain nuclease of toxin-antitoxin system